MDYRKFLSKVQERIVPEDDAAERFAKELCIKISAELKRRRIGARVTPGGSIAKGTFIRDDHDVDIFVRFSYTYKGKDISSVLQKPLKKLFPKIERLHGSRDYFHLRGRYNVEIVPVLDIGDPTRAVNVTDMSPLHVDWVKQHIDRRLADDIRLAKVFCKAAGVYGAESYIKGFSGHVLDILVIHYKGFIRMLKAASRWKPNHVIDFYNHYHGKALQLLNNSKISPLIVIDPICPERNAAAALSREKLDEFRKAAEKFLKRPSAGYFEKKELTLDDLKKKAKDNKLLVIDIKGKKGKKDIVGTKFLKVYEMLRNNLVFRDFKVRSSGWKWDEESRATLWFIVDRKPLSEKKKQIGPPISSEQHAEQFKKKHKNVSVRGKRLYALVKRDFRQPDKLIQHLLKTMPEIKKRITGFSFKSKV